MSLESKKRQSRLDYIIDTRGWAVVTTHHRDQRKGLIPSTKPGPVYETRLDKFYPSIKGNSKEFLPYFQSFE